MAKKNPFVDMVVKLGPTFARGSDINPASKSPEFRQIRSLPSCSGVRNSLLSLREETVNKQGMVESIRPKYRLQVCTSEEGANHMCNGLVRAFSNSILVGSIRASGMDGIPMLAEEIPDIWMATKLPSQVHAGVTIPGFGLVTREPPVQPLDGRILAAGCVAPHLA